MNAWFGRVGGADALPEKMPAIWLVTDPACPESSARFIANGCEEEGIPLAWYAKEGGADELARFACLRSQLEVGIGLAADGSSAIAVVAVTDKPYISVGPGTAARLRWLGQAAARISKSQPIPESPVPSARTSDNTSGAEKAQATEDDLESMIRMASLALLKELNGKGGALI
jgi:hypothetical protein